MDQAGIQSGLGSHTIIDYPSLAREVNYHLVSSFVVLLWDVVITFRNEVKYIWPIPWTSFFKWLYLYLRYVSIAAHIFHMFVIPHLNSGKASRSSCFAWFTYGAIISQLHMSSIEVILAIRVYALFNKSRRIAMVLALEIMLEYAMLVLVVFKYFPAIVFVPYCILIKPPYQIMYHTAFVLTTQTTLVVLALTKHVFAKRSGWGRTPLVSLLIRDGAAMYFIACVFFVSAIVICEVRDERSIIIIAWSIPIISSGGCRLIVNMQRLAADNNAHAESLFDITSQIEIELPPVITQLTQ